MYATFIYARPASLDVLLGQMGGNSLLYAGGTDLLVLLRAKKISATHVLDVKGIPELGGIRDEGDFLSIGATCTLAEIQNNPLVLKTAPALAQGCRAVGSVQIRNKATLGGNIQNASPAGDGLNAAFALDGSVELFRESGSRVLSLDSFVLGPRKTVLDEGEVITRIRIPKRGWTHQVFFKTGRRNALAISVVNGAVALKTDDSGIVTDARISLGAVAPTPVRIPEAESLLVGRPLAAADLERVRQAVSLAVRPISDVRASAEYRRYISGVSVLRAIRSFAEGTIL